MKCVASFIQLSIVKHFCYLRIPRNYQLQHRYFCLFATSTHKLLHVRTSCQGRIIVHMTSSRRVTGRVSVILFDVMDTLVRDPFYQGMHRVFGFKTLQDFIRATNHETWLEFELGNITEEQVAERFFKISCLEFVPEFNWKNLKQFLWKSYCWVEGIEPILKDLKRKDGLIQLHILSNYPPLYKLIEQKLQVSRYLPWTFISCDIGIRKPDLKIYQYALEKLQVSPEHCLFIDDRQVNCDAARKLGLHTIQFTNSLHLRMELQKYFDGLDS